MEIKGFNYRLVEKENYFEEKYYEVHEVYYDRRGKITGWSKEPISIGVSDLKELKQQVKHIRDAGRKTVLRIEGKKMIDTGRKIRREERL